MKKYLLPLINSFEEHSSKDFGYYMYEYMMQRFHFLGIKTPLRKELQKEFFTTYGYPDTEKIWDTVCVLWNMKYREFHHTAIDIVDKHSKKLDIEWIYKIEELISSNSWWDSVDHLSARIAGPFLKKDPDKVKEISFRWIESDNFWLQRSSILLQLKYKADTDLDLLESILVRRSDSDEFFIQKAIGWMLREFSRVNPEWVEAFVESHQLSELSQKEAIRLILTQKIK